MARLYLTLQCPACESDDIEPIQPGKYICIKCGFSGAQHDFDEVPILGNPSLNPLSEDDDDDQR